MVWEGGRPIYKSSVTGRADLVDCYARFRTEGLVEMAKSLNLEASNAQVPNKKKKQTQRSVTAEILPPPTAPETKPIEEGFWRVTGYKSKVYNLDRAEPEWYRFLKPLNLADMAGDPNATKPPRPELLAWSRLWPYLKAILGGFRETRILDVPALADCLAAGKVPRRIPKIRRRSWKPRCQVLLDFSLRLRPFWDDMRDLISRLSALRGEFGLELWVLPEGIQGSWLRDDGDAAGDYTLPDSGTPVLALSDLGALEPSGREANIWADLGRSLVQNECSTHALAPCSLDEFDHRLLEGWHPAVWDRGARLPLTGQLPRRTQNIMDGPDSGAEEQAVPLLLALLSPAIRVEPELLRAMRYLLPAEIATAALEARIWNHPHIQASRVAFSYLREPALAYRREFATAKYDPLRDEALQIIRAWHRNLSPAIQYEEIQIGRSLAAQALTQDEDDFFKRIAVTLATGDVAWVEWFDRFTRRQNPEIWISNKGAATAWVLVHKDEIDQGIIEIPEGVNLHEHAWIWGKAGPPQTWVIDQSVDEAVFRRQRDPAEGQDWSRVGPLAVLTSGDRIIQYNTEAGGFRSNLLLEDPTRLPLWNAGHLDLQTDHQVVTLRREPMPPWCTEMGRDGKGLFARLGEAENFRKLYWLNPGRYEIGNADSALYFEWGKGRWMDENQFELWREGRFEKPDWLTQIGVDQYGVFGDARIGKVIHRFRWIMPGSFAMGSPKDEPERYDNEIQHDVLLTRGFWLAETACTQELWQAVMGKNPSRFKGSQRPVEMVSYNDVIEFLAKANKLDANLKMRLPTEAEWEYACRAGTRTRFHFGETITADQVNYDGTVPPEGSPKGEDRNGTIEVRSLPCNDWGLYEMHGNVLEWCADWYGSYGAELALDPKGADGGGSRVLRGGSWIGDGRYVRSACRSMGEPVYRRVIIGFRLSRG